MQPPPHFDLCERLRWHADQRPDQLAFGYLASDEALPLAALTYGQLDRQARALAQVLQQTCAPQQRVILLVPTGLSFVVALMGCLYANLIAVPVPAEFNDSKRLKRLIPRLRAIAKDAQPSLILGNRESLAQHALIIEQAPELASLNWLNLDELPPNSDHWQVPLIAAEDLIFLQYSSGSTGQPKGVMVSHNNLMCNAAHIQAAFGHDFESVGVSWLPPYHDMGLVADLLQVIFSGHSQIIFSPFAFIARPLRWLQVISDYQATTSGAPNFAYALCLNKISPAERDRLDLSSWQVAYNCAEPVQAQVQADFAAFFGPVGFREQAFFPFLGMAESTLMVSAGQHTDLARVLRLSRAGLKQGQVDLLGAGALEQQVPTNSKTLVSNGKALPGHDLAIVDPETGVRCSADRIGEIWVTGPSVAQGYWQQSAQTLASFKAQLKDSSDQRFYLRTGDLGFLSQAELFITGRHKDLLIIQGQNHYPQDLEQSIEAAHSAIRPGCSAAFGLFNDDPNSAGSTVAAESLVLMAEIQADQVSVLQDQPLALQTIAQTLQQAIWEGHQIWAQSVLLLPPQGIPKTSSGKIQRRACREQFEAGMPDRLVHWQSVTQQLAYRAPVSQLEQILCQTFAQFLDLPQVGLNDHFFALGGHSLLATEMVSTLAAALQRPVAIQDLFRYPTLAELAHQLSQRDPQTLSQQAEQQIKALKPGPQSSHPLSAAQERIWFIEQLSSDRQAYLMPRAWRLTGPLNLAALQWSLSEILRRHRIFSLGIQAATDGSPEQSEQSKRFEQSFELELQDFQEDLSPPLYQDLALNQALNQAAQEPFELSQAPLMRVSLFRIKPNEQLLLVNMHHLVSDGWSYGVFWQELSTLYGAYQGSGQVPIRSPLLPLSLQYLDYVYWQREQLASGLQALQLHYWCQKLSGLKPIKIPDDSAALRLSLPTADQVSKIPIVLHLSLPTLQRLNQLAQAESISLYILLLSAFKALLYRYSAQRDLAVGSPVSGRHPGGSEPLIGLFVNTLIMRTQLSAQDSFRELIQQVKSTVLEAYTHQDLPLDQIVSALNPERQGEQNPLFEILFALQNTPHAAPALAGLELNAYPLPDLSSRLDLEFQLWQQDTGLEIQLYYRPERFADWRMQSLLQGFGSLLTEMAQTPAILQCPVQDLPLMLAEPEIAASDRSEEIEIIADTPDLQCLKKIADFCRLQAEKVALRSHFGSWSYAELNNYRQAMALKLESLDLSSRASVGVCLPAGPDKAAVIWALLEAGFCVVPLSAELDSKLLAGIIELSQMACLIVPGKQLKTLSTLSLTGARIEQMLDFQCFRDRSSASSRVEPGAKWAALLYCWNAAGDLIALPYTSAHFESALYQPVQADLEATLWLSFWRDLSQGKTHSLALPLPTYPSADGVSAYHAWDLGHSAATFSSRLSSLQTPERSDLQAEPAYLNGGELIFPAGAPRTVTEMIVQAAQTQNRGLRVIDAQGQSHWQSYQDLIQKSLQICERLQALALVPQQALVLHLRSASDHFAAFLAAILGGFVPVTVAIPAVYQPEQAGVQKLLNLLELLDWPMVLCNRAEQAELLRLAQAQPHGQLAEQLYCLDDLMPAPAVLKPTDTMPAYPADPSQSVFYQLSSGSTGIPKCIQITHRGVVAHCEAAGQFNSYQAEDVWLNWIPVDHVVPILTWFLQALYRRADFIHVDSSYILAAPVRWLDLLDRYQVQHSWAPNFAFQLVANALAACPESEPPLWDLSGLKSLMNAGEQVTQSAMQAFFEQTQSFGLSETVLNPAFGMAESCTCMTYALQFDLASSDFYLEADKTAFINTGAVIPGVEVRIVGADNTLLQVRQIGRFQIRGDVISSGYYANPEANREAFVGAGWLNTGDLGFIHEQGLYITGREKEMILVHGANLYCYEIEALVAAIPGVEPASVGVFPLSDSQTGSEGFGLAYVPQAAETDTDWLVITENQGLELLDTIYQRLSEQLGLAPQVVFALPASAFPKTTSGKIQRAKLAQNLAAGVYDQQVKAADVWRGQNNLAASFYQASWQDSPRLLFPESIPLRQTQLLIVAEATDWSEALLEQLRPLLQGVCLHDPQQDREAEWLTQLAQAPHLVVMQLAESAPATSSHYAQYLSGTLTLAQGLLKHLRPGQNLHWVFVQIASPVSDPAQNQRVYPIDEALSACQQGFLTSLAQERLQCSVHIVDSLGLAPGVLAELLTQELRHGFGQQLRLRYQVSDQQLLRQWRCLEQVHLQARSTVVEPFAAEDFTLVLGGLGGIGFELSQAILAYPQQELMIVGRRSSAAAQDQVQTLQASINTGSRLHYHALDILQPEHLSELMERLEAASEHNQGPLSTIVQALGQPYPECPIAELTPQLLLQQLRLKLASEQIISAVLQRWPQCRVIDIGSVNGFFGGAQVSAYAAAQGYVDGLAQQMGPHYYGLHQSLWNQTGLSKNRANLGFNKGFLSLSPEKGVQGVLALLQQEPGVYYAGLNGRKHFVEQQVSLASRQAQLRPAYSLPMIDLLLGHYLNGQTQVLSQIRPRTEHSTAPRLKLLDSKQRSVPAGFIGQLYLQIAPELIATGITAHTDPQGNLCLIQSASMGTADLIAQKISHRLQVLGLELDLRLIRRALRPQESTWICYLQGTNQGLNLPQIAAQIQAFLPWFWQPAAYHQLKDWPLTAAGHLEIKHLALRRLQTQAHLSEALTPNQILLCEIFSEILERPQVSPQDDFFSLGGHSLLAIRLLASIQERTGVLLPLSRLFQTPKIADLALLLKPQADESPTELWPALLSRPREQAARLSSAQERLWFMHQLQSEAQIYNTLFCLKLQGDLNLHALQASLQQWLRRHQILRTAFSLPEASDQPHSEAPNAIVAAACLLELPVLDLRSETDPEKRAAELAQELAQIPFDLSQSPLLRVCILRLEDATYQLQLVIHHIISDAISIRILFQELAADYCRLLAGDSASLSAEDKDSASPLTYLDYAAWQQELISQNLMQEQLEFWLRELAQLPERLALPTDWPRPAQESFRGAHLHFEIEGELAQRIQQLSQSLGCTRFMFLLAVFQVLLSRYSQQTDISVGVPVANRALPALEQVVGLFVNTLVIRGDLSQDPSFREFLGQIKQRCLGAFAHQELPFEKVVEGLNPVRSLSHHPLFQVLFLWQEEAVLELELPDLVSQFERPARGESQFDLSLELMPLADSDGLSGRLEYSCELFAAESMQRLIGHFVQLLDAVLADLERPLSQLQLITEQERNQLICDWNQTRVDYPKDRYLHQFFEANAAQQGDAVAVVAASQQLTYAELNTEANRLAHYLIAEGLGPEHLVGISIPRSLEMMLGLLAILKAGAAYVPLDPDYPLERLRFMCEDTQISWLLSHSQSPELMMGLPLRILKLDQEALLWQDQPSTNPSLELDLERLISVIYTSGSTGKPKGVMNTQLGAYNHLYFRQMVYPMTPADRIIQKSSLNFDGSLWECFWPLMAGARLYLAAPDGHKDSQYLARFIQEHQITMIDFVPAMLQAILHEPELDFASLRRVWCGGEGLSYDLQQAFFARFPEIDLVHGYGPTETTVSVTYWNCQQKTSRPGVPIGYPNANIQTYLLDRHLQPVPIGLTGELYIGGDGLARGYLRRPELSAERFIANPFGSGRLYQSGDLARYWPNGAIEFLGRQDHQVKLRGFRIELGEIESVIRQHAEVDDCVVQIQPGQDAILIAYLSGIGSDSSALVNLKLSLGRQLPDYMLPGVFVCLEQLPLDPNGKVDRKALPAVDLAQHFASSSTMPARTLTEARLLEAFDDLLPGTQAGPGDSFFDLGGHSLLATQLASRLRQRFGIELPLKQIFLTPRPLDLARAIDEIQLEALPALENCPRSSALSLSFAQERLWFMDQWEPNSSLYNIPALVQLKGPLDQAALESALRALVARHEALRTRFVERLQQPQQAFIALPTEILEHRDFSSAPFAQPLAKRLERAQQAAQAELQQPFDLASGPLFRFVLFALEPNLHLLTLTMHHIISDGWSWKLFEAELTAAYRHFLAFPSQALPWPELRFQYADYAHWQREWFQGAVLQDQLAYWQKQLQGLNGCLQWPGVSRPAQASYRGARKLFHWDLALKQDLEQLARKQGVTLFILLLAAFQALIYRYCQQTDLAVGIPIANRRHSEWESMLGFFVNTLVIRTDLADNPPFESLLAQVKARCLDAYAHQDLPFEKVVEVLNPERSLAYHPVFQSLFVLQETPGAPLSFPHLETTVIPAESQQARFDLACECLPHAEGLSLRIEYAYDLFDDADISRWVDQFETLLRGIVADSRTPLDALPLNNLAAEARLLAQAAGPDYPQRLQLTISACFEAQAQQRPDHLALVCGDQQLTYAELNAEANRWAQWLQLQGVQVGQNLAVCLPKSLPTYVLLLACLKMGAVYLPLDPSYPLARLSYILDDAEPALVLGSAHPLQRETQIRWVEIDAIALDSLADLRPEPIAWQPAPQDLAYLIYTSGSTGQPKGVQVCHEGFCNMVLEQIEAFGLTPEQRVLQFAALSFDASLSEIFMAWLSGASLWVASKWELMPGPDLQGYIRQHRITTLILTPSALAQMPLPESRSDWPLQTLILAGEACPTALAAAWLPFTRVFNAYGPTETSVCASWQAFEPGYENLPMGKVLPNLSAYILTAGGQLEAEGLAGQLWLGGIGLARGYYRRAELTQERFIANPFGPGRLYNTGDRVCRLPAGQLMYLGRDDQQIKLRGFRIEAAEIESQIMGCAGIQSAIVLSRSLENKSGSGSETDTTLRALTSQALVAYIVPEALADFQAELAADQIQQWQSLYQTTHVNWDQQTLGHNFSDWNSALTQSALPIKEMQRWRAATVERIRALAPRRIYEIGCGRGLLISQLAAEAELYLASDFSHAVLAETSALKQAQQWQQLQLFQARADDFSALKVHDLDCLILNSVVQYFPSAQYLTQVLAAACDHLADQAKIFIGDVRALALLPLYYAEIQTRLQQSQSLSPLDSLALSQQVFALEQAETELCFDPQFFAALPACLPRIAAVEILLKAGDYQNELNCYRYDVVLHLDQLPATEMQQEIQGLKNSSNALPALRSAYQAQPGCYGLKGLANAHLQSALKAVLSLTPSEMLLLPDQADLLLAEAFAPADFYALGQELGAELKVYQSRRPGFFDVIISPQVLHFTDFPETSNGNQPNLFSNQPLLAAQARRLKPLIQAHLKAQLPEQLQPQYYLFLSRWPLSAHGKLDRAALPDPLPRTGAIPKQSQTQMPAISAPLNPFEATLGSIFEQVLQQPVGRQDSFFALGGHSLMAIQLIGAIQERLQIQLPLKKLFEYPTVQGLAEVLQSQAPQSQSRQALPEATALGGKLSYSQELWWTIFPSRELLEDGIQNSYLVLRLQGLIDAKKLADCLQMLVTRHESLRTTFVSIDKNPRRVVDPDLNCELQQRDCSGLSAQEALLRLQAEAQAPFDLVQGPLIRSVLYHCQSDKLLLISISHLVVDGGSLKTLLLELQALYAGKSLPELKHDYSDYVAWHRKWIRRRLPKQMAYWLWKGKDMPVILDLPTDLPRTSNLSLRGGGVCFEIDTQLSQALQALARQQQATLYMVLLGCFQIVLHHYSANPDIFVGSPVANRPLNETREMVGLFLNFVVLRQNLSGNPSFSDFLEQVKGTCLGAFEHQDLPFQMLLKSFKAFKTLTALQAFQTQTTMRSNVMFNLVDDFGSDLELGQAKGQMLSIESDAASQTMHLIINRKTDGLSAQLIYSSDLFYRETIEAIAEHYLLLLRHFSADPYSPILSHQAQLQTRIQSDRIQRGLT